MSYPSPCIHCWHIEQVDYATGDTHEVCCFCGYKQRRVHADILSNHGQFKPHFNYSIVTEGGTHAN